MHLLHNVSFIKLLTSFVMNSKIPHVYQHVCFLKDIISLYDENFMVRIHSKPERYSQKLTLCIAAAAVAQYATYLCILSQKWQNCTLGKHSSELVRYEHMYSRVHDHLTCVFLFSPGKKTNKQCNVHSDQK